MSLLPPDLRRGWTLADLDRLPDDDQRYELVDGGLVVTPPPTQWHQEVASRLRDLLHDAAPAGWRCRTEFPLPLSDDTQRVPDVVVFRWPLQHPRGDPRNRLGPGDVGLVVEVVSPSTRRTDRFAKPGDYAEAGIALFWRVETEPQVAVHALVLRGPAYEVVATVTTRGTLPVPWGDVAVDVGQLAD